ncbi:MAG: hypothetical protein HUU50_21985 [Candidatus Brocadiae bacterium]|nr:hypothetical protein [Candidatus Brocadiia bacterium]
MNLIQWPGWKLLIFISIDALFLGLIYTISGMLPSFLVSIEYWGNAIRIAFTMAISMSGIVFLGDALPEFYGEQEEEILDELSIHKDPSLFRISLFIGLNAMFAWGILASISWPFWIALLLGGTLLWLIISEFFLCLWAYGIEGIGEFFGADQTMSFLFLTILSIALLLSGYIGFLLTTATQHKESLPKSRWEEVHDFFNQAKENWQKTWDDKIQKKEDILQQFPQVQKQLEEKIKQLDLTEMQLWIEKLHKCRNINELQFYMNSLEEYIEKKKK